MPRSAPEISLRQLAAWCRRHFGARYSDELAQSVESLLLACGELAAVPTGGSIDRFDRIRELEARIDALLADLAATYREQRAAARETSPRSPMATTRLFVYGTLKRGGSRAGALHSQRFLAEVRTAPRYRMYDCGGYPGLVECADGAAIEGELWEIDGACLAALDAIEGVELNLYRRAAVCLEPAVDSVPCEAYFYLRDVSGLRDCGTNW